MSDTSCQILTVSSSLDQATSLIHRIRSLDEKPTTSNSGEIAQSSTTTTETSASSDEIIPSPSSGSMEKIPWTISNRYYSADVHFAAHAMRGLSSHLVKSSPAVIFVWSEGEAYKHHIERLSQGLDGHEPEVSLAVRIRTDSEPVDPEDEAEDNSTIDGFLSSHGFEYIDAARELPHGSWRTKNEDSEDGIPHLPRVLDALSTIMWPSMQTKNTSRGRKDRSLEGSSILSIEERIARDPVIKLIDDMSTSKKVSRRSEETDDELELLKEGLANSSLGGAPAKQDEVPSGYDVNDLLAHANERLEWWKYEGNGKLGKIIESPVEQNSSTPFGTTWGSGGARGAERGNVSLRFDDDFTEFVSSPPIGIQSAPPELAFDRDSPSSDRSVDTTIGLQVAHTYQYQALRSSSQMGFGDEEERKYEHLLEDEDDDDLLPTKDEILQTSARIFGNAIRSSERVNTSEPRPNKSSTASDEPAASSPPKQSVEELFSSDTLSDLMGVGDGEYDMASFDISKVISALQHMKAEIAGMENEDERRKAAAKVALGLVYGLEADAQDD